MTYAQKDMAQDAKQFRSSQYGKHVLQILEQKKAGHLSSARNVKEEHPDRYLAKYDEVESLLELLLDDSISPRG